jgi:hypothetical protein
VPTVVTAMNVEQVEKRQAVHRIDNAVVVDRRVIADRIAIIEHRPSINITRRAINQAQVDRRMTNAIEMAIVIIIIVAAVIVAVDRHETMISTSSS